MAIHLDELFDAGSDLSKHSFDLYWSNGNETDSSEPEEPSGPPSYDETLAVVKGELDKYYEDMDTSGWPRSTVVWVTLPHPDTVLSATGRQLVHSMVVEAAGTPESSLGPWRMGTPVWLSRDCDGTPAITGLSMPEVELSDPDDPDGWNVDAHGAAWRPGYVDSVMWSMYPPGRAVPGVVVWAPGALSVKDC